MSSFSEQKSESTIRLEIGKPFGVGMNTTEGERVLKALREIQHKLNHQKNYSKDGNKLSNKTTNVSFSASGDQNIHKSNKCTNTSIDGNYNKYRNELIETRLQLIEKQLENITKLMTCNRNGNIHLNPYPTPSPSAISGNEEYTSLQTHIDRNKYKSNAITINKSKSMETINKCKPSKHFHLQYKDIPFLLGNCSKSHSVIANRQIEISKLKQHNHLCESKPTRKIFSDKIKTNLLDNEIKELLYDLQEEHNYICEEIQHLTKHLESITDDHKRAHFKRELYFLSRRILAKKKQINELQELHEIIMKNTDKKYESIDKSIVGEHSRKKVLLKSISNEYLPKWV